MNAWDQLPNEPNRWFRRFERYCRMGSNRYLLGCVNDERAEQGKGRVSQTPGSWSDAAAAWDWESRAAEFDNHNSRIAQAAWDEKFRKFEEKKWVLVDKLLERANQMLEFPLADVKREEITENDRLVSVTHIYPTKWVFRDAATILEVVAKLMQPYHADDDGDGERPAVQINLSGLSVDILRAIANEDEPAPALQHSHGE